MVPLKPFCNLTNLYFSIYPSQYEKNLADEIYGCFKYIGIPIEAAKRLPIQERRYYISKHNEEQLGYQKAREKKSGSQTITGDQINDFAKLEQANTKREGGYF